MVKYRSIYLSSVSGPAFRLVKIGTVKHVSLSGKVKLGQELQFNTVDYL